jgi:hypothetical protein
MIKSLRNIPLNAKIRVLVPANPKRPGSFAYEAFTAYAKPELTVQEFAENGGLIDHLAWDLKKGFVSVEAAAQ